MIKNKINLKNKVAAVKVAAYDFTGGRATY